MRRARILKRAGLVILGLIALDLAAGAAAVALGWGLLRR